MPPPVVVDPSHYTLSFSMSREQQCCRTGSPLVKLAVISHDHFIFCEVNETEIGVLGFGQPLARMPCSADKEQFL